MKKILSILMTLVMLLSACAFAEADDAFEGVQITLSDIVAFAGETPILDLTGLSLGLGGALNDAGAGGLQLSLGAAGNEVLSLNMGLSGEQLLLAMTGVTGIYSLDLAAVAESAGVDLDAVTDLDVEQVTQAISPEDQMALMALLMEAVALVQANTTNTTEEIEGVIYDVTTVEVTPELLMPLIEKALPIADKYSDVLADTGFESFTQLYTELAPAVGLNGTILDAEDSSVLDFTVTGSLHNGEQSGFVMLYLEGAEADDDTALYIEAYAGSDEEYYGVAFNLDFSDENDGSWIPASDAPVDLLAALEDETQSQQLMLQAMSSVMMAMSQIAAANQTVAALMGNMMGA